MKQLIVVADMEGASGIFEENRAALYHEEVYPQETLWRDFGRKALTSDVLAVCEGANAAGVDEILLYDMHFAGCKESNILLDRLPKNVRIFDLPNRCFIWPRIRGQAAWAPWGLVTVGQHARFGEENAFFPHTIQSPPIQGFWVNGFHIAEIGMAVLAFRDTPYVANVGCAASHREARELSPAVACVSVKDKAGNWRPSPEETFPLIREGVYQALLHRKEQPSIRMEDPCVCALELTAGYEFLTPAHVSWKGEFSPQRATWEAPNAEIALVLFDLVRACIRKV